MIRAVLASLGVLTIFALAGLGSLFGGACSVPNAGSEEPTLSADYDNGWCAGYSAAMRDRVQQGLGKPAGVLVVNRGNRLALSIDVRGSLVECPLPVPRGQ